eukprot:scaffold8889_cov74-Cyclotella_meneghiniana.AAC.5
MEGHAWATGSNSKGQLCLGDESDRFTPEMISLEGVRIVDVAIGGEHTLLLDEQGNVFGCGSNEMGQLGLLSSTKKTDTPLKIYTLPPTTSISSGRDHSLFLTEDGAYVTGSNEFGQLCVDTKGKSLYEAQSLDIPADIITSFEAISSSSYILFSDGSVIGCGNNDVGQLGNGENETETFEPTVVETKGLVVNYLGVGPSAKSVFFFTDEGVYGTGLNSDGQLGVGDLEDRNLPTLVLNSDTIELNLISAGDYQTFALCLFDEIQTNSPTQSVSSLMPTTATYEPTSATYEPTSLTNAPSIVSTENPTTIAPLGFPTFSPSGLTSSIPTISATDLPTTYSPSIDFLNSTYSPTPALSTYAPSTYAPTEEGVNFFFWGNPASIGQESDENVTEPLTIDGDITYASAGSRYSLIVMVDGSALSFGVIESIENYKGHLGIEIDDLVEGINAVQMITNISDTNDTVLDSPAFDMAFAGVESTPDS